MLIKTIPRKLIPRKLIPRKLIPRKGKERTSVHIQSKTYCFVKNPKLCT